MFWQNAEKNILVVTTEISEPKKGDPFLGGGGGYLGIVNEITTHDAVLL